MSDKISEERLAQLEASLQEVGNAFGWASISEQLELVRIARRAAELSLLSCQALVIINTGMTAYGFVSASMKAPSLRPSKPLAAAWKVRYD